MNLKRDLIEEFGYSLENLQVKLQNTTLLIISGFDAFAMCGALNIEMYNTPKMLERKVVCFRAVGVKTINELYNSPILEASISANEVGIYAGMKVNEAFRQLSS